MQKKKMKKSNCKMIDKGKSFEIKKGSRFLSSIKRKMDKDWRQTVKIHTHRNHNCNQLGSTQMSSKHWCFSLVSLVS